jgi:hypothetical protein
MVTDLPGHRTTNQMNMRIPACEHMEFPPRVPGSVFPWSDRSSENRAAALRDL